MDHDRLTLLSSYNRNCPGCRMAIRKISERTAREWLAVEAAQKKLSRIKLQNAIAIWQQANRRAMKEPR